jgi:hypothetical protein
MERELSNSRELRHKKKKKKKKKQLLDSNNMEECDVSAAVKASSY